MKSCLSTKNCENIENLEMYYFLIYQSHHRTVCTLKGTQICASGAKLFSDTCHGDSGGPLVGIDPISKQVEVVGILSFGVNKCNGVKPAVYTRVAKYLPWIKDFINKAS